MPSLVYGDMSGLRGGSVSATRRRGALVRNRKRPRSEQCVTPPDTTSLHPSELYTASANMDTSEVEAPPRERRIRYRRRIRCFFLFVALFLLISPQKVHGGGGGAHATDGRKRFSGSDGAPGGSSDGTATGPPTTVPSDGASSSVASSAAVVICSVDGTVYTLDPWSGNLRGIFASGPALVSSSTDGRGETQETEGEREHEENDTGSRDIDDDDEYTNLFDSDGSDSDNNGPDSDGEGGDNTSSSFSKQEERIVPGLDGHLYSLLPSLSSSDQSTGLRLQRLPISVADVVDSPISTCSSGSGTGGDGDQNGNECNLVMGEKQTKLFRLDPATGRVVWMQRPTGRNGGFTAADSGMLSAGTDGMSSAEEDVDSDEGDHDSTSSSSASASVLLQREDYLLRSVDSATGEERWNVTVGRFSALDFGSESDAKGADDSNQQHPGTSTSSKTATSSRENQRSSQQMPELPHRLTEFDATFVDSDSKDDSDGRGGDAYLLDLVPLPSVVFGEDGTTITAVDTTNDKILWQRELDSVVAAVYGVEPHHAGDHTGRWTSLDVIDDFDFAKEEGEETQQEQHRQLASEDKMRMLPPPHADLPPVERLTQGSKLDSISGELSLPPSISPERQLITREGVSRALIPYGYGHGALEGAALISEPPDPITGMSPSTQYARIGMQSSTIFVASTSDSYLHNDNPILPFDFDDTCESMEQEDADGLGSGVSTMSTDSSIDSIDFESLLLEHGLLPPGATAADLQTYGALYSSLLDAMQHTHRTNHGLFLSWRIVAMIVCGFFGAFLGIRVRYNRQKKLWEAQQPLQSPILNATYGIQGDSGSLSTPRSGSDSLRSPLYPVELKHVDSVPPLSDFDLPKSQPHRSPVQRSLSMPAINSLDPDVMDIGDAFQEQTFDLKVFAEKSDVPLLRATTIATSTTGTTPATSAATAQPSPVAHGDRAVSEPAINPYTVDNLDGIPLVRYSRYSSEFRELSALGRGGFGTVFRCTNALDGRLYAIKKIRIKTQVSMDGSVGVHFKEKLHRVLREVKILALLDHPNIVRYYTAWLELEEGVEKNGDGSEALPERTLGRCYSSDLLTGASPSVSVSSSLGPMRGAMQLTRSPTGRKTKPNPLGWNNFSGAFDRNSSLFETSEEGEALPRPEMLRRETSDDDLGFNWERSSSGLSRDASIRRGQILKKSSKMTSDLSVVGDDEKEEESSSSSSGRSSREPQFCSSRSLSEIDEEHHDSKPLGESPLYPAATSEAAETTIRGDEVTIEQVPEGQKQQLRNQRHILYIQMQLCSQKTLADFLSNPKARRGEDGSDTSTDEIVSEKKIVGGIDLPHALHLFIQISRGVKHVHAQGLIHRDLKPMNCFIDEAGTVKIGDFGLSRESSNPDADLGGEVDVDLDTSQHDRRSSLGAGEDNTVGVGTRSYASPEQMSGSDYDASTDIYSLGIILFELCYPMYTGMERHTVFRGLRQRTFPDQWNKTVGVTFPSLHKLLLEMLSLHPEDRPTSEAVVDRVDTLLGEYTCDLLGLDFDMYQKLRKLDRATQESGRQRSSSIGGGLNTLEENLE